MKTKRIMAICGLLMGSFSPQAQTLFPPSLAIAEKENTINKRVVPYTHLREADVMWEKRVWRVIDLREKINHPLYFPTSETSSRHSLIQVLKKALLSNEIIAFSDPEFLSPLSLAEVEKKLVKCDSIEPDSISEITGEALKGKKRQVCDVEAIYNQVISYEVMEEWFFDKQKSTMEVRILSICPRKYDEEKDLHIPLFYVYFPSCRPVLARNEVFNSRNDAERRSYDDIFQKRMFNSYITKESNVYDRNIAEYAHGIDALLESERIKENVFKCESDLWHY